MMSKKNTILPMAMDKPSAAAFFESVAQVIEQARCFVGRTADLTIPTVGILLCKEKNDNVVELTLPDGANIYASEYSLYLPDKELLQRKLAEWVEEFEEEKELTQLADESAKGE